ncbi:hypothetical protein [Teredinibacter sp. KSP-S5-2]|uniref:hypothetical protein n=1 Tax=Teredinibacter sp. KSP-S5-2 TaxID=3034506 RepID=UPI002934FC01|nr:hypothetical protein [Teredinibacter sp. KSP-S5-2]WNO10325.1 hypothetical protein P5V12_03975 [Teredinibacter sp. KSP-S5-2]
MKTCTILSLMFAATISSANECNFTPQTELETLYCQVSQTHPKPNLVNIYEFRKNPPKVQKLILKPHLKKMGLELPKDSSDKANAKTNTQTDQPIQDNQLSNCSLTGNTIRCNRNTYTLLTNKNNNELSQLALSQSNRLDLPEKKSPIYTGKSDQEYLSSIYPYYLEKMIGIGLAEVTMTFTKFVATYKTIVAEKKSFSTRFETMYEFLKKDKKHNRIERNTRPVTVTIEQCYFAGRKLIVCDDVNHNWLFSIAEKR